MDDNEKAEVSSDLNQKIQEEDSEMDQIKKVGATTDEEGSSIFGNSSGQVNITSKRKKSKAWIFIIITLILFGFGGFLLRHQIKGLVSGVAKSQPTPTPTPTEKPSPTPSPLVRSDWSFELLNGTAVSGLAKKVADKITALGYQVVKLGNADKSNYQKTTIIIKKDLEDKVNLVIADLKDIVKISSISGDLKDSTVSATIILGKDINE